MEENEKDGLPIRNLIFNDDTVGVYACSLVNDAAIGIEFIKFSNEIIDCNCSNENSELVDFSDEFIELLLSKGETIDTDNWELLDEKPIQNEDDYLDFAEAVPQSFGDSELDNEIFKVRFEYSPLKTSSNSRDFCKKMVSANRSYKAEDLKFSNANPGFGPKGEDSYSILNYKGGVNCNHYFTRKIYFNKGNKAGVNTFEALKRIGKLDKSDAKKAKLTALDPKVSQVADASNNYWRLSTQEIKFSTEQSHKQILTSPVLIPEQLIFRKLSDGDCYVKATAETIEQLQQNFFKKQYNHNSTKEHNEQQIIEGVYFFESWIVQDPNNDKAKSLGFDVPKGTWVMSLKVDNPVIWKEVLDGKYKGFSIDSQLGIEPLKKEKNKKEQMNYSKVKEAIIAKILLEAELKSFKIDDSLTLQAEDLAKDQVVFDSENQPFANAEFVFENNTYKTDENGVIVEIEPVEEVEIEQAEDAPADEAPANNVREELDAANKKIEEMETEIQSLKAEIVSLKDENINLAKQPKVEGINLNNQEADNAPATSALDAIRKALK